MIPADKEGRVVYQITFWYMVVAITVVAIAAVYSLLTAPDRQVVVDCSAHAVVCKNIDQDGTDEQLD